MMGSRGLLSAVFLLFLINAELHSVGGQLVNNYICGVEFCKNYIETSSCAPLEEPCLAQNATMNGIILPSQTPCSCCESCLEHLHPGDDCTLGLIGAPVPSSVCGPDLTCTRGLDEEHAKCQMRTDTTCLVGRREFNQGIDTGTLGHMMIEPDCDSLGEFSAFRCIPGQICFCVDKWGQRIFGEALNVPGMSILMRCQCAREEAHLRQLLNVQGFDKYLRCDAMGSYQRLQCLGDKCICVDRHTGSPASPAYNRTNLSDLQEDWKCFDGSEEPLIERVCEVRRQELAKKRPNYITSHDLATMCQPDGWFNRVQRNESHRYCVDQMGRQIGNYAEVVDDGPKVNRINCNCARVVDLLRTNKRIEYPQCCPNGNYQRINCRRGLCYCVDANGQQTSAEVPRHRQSLLTCAVDEFEAGGSSKCN